MANHTSAKPFASISRSNVAALFGTMLENYDLLLFAHLLHPITATFFPQDNPFWTQKAKDLLFFLVFPLRLLGGGIFGHFADRLGRGKGMLFSMVLMGLPTMTIALLPGYERIGFIAVPIICFCRLMQGFSAGAEFPQAATVILENATPSRKAFASSMNQVFLYSGGLVSAICAFLFTQPFMPSWGWRAAFLVGSCIAAFGLYMRRKIAETPEFEKLNKENKILASPFLETLKRDWRSHLYYCAICLGFNLLYTNAIVGAPSIVRSKFGFSTPQVLLTTIFVMSCAIACLPIFGLLADRIGARKVVSGGIIVSSIMIIMSFKASESGDFYSFMLFHTLSIVAFSAQSAPSHSLTKYLYPTDRRCSGVSLGSGVGMAIGGLSPLMLNMLRDFAGGFWGPSMLAILLQTISLIGVCFAPSFAPKASSSSAANKVVCI